MGYEDESVNVSIREGDVPARGIPVRIVECPAVKKPGKRADEAQRRAYREAIKAHNLSQGGLQVMKNLRARLDERRVMPTARC